MKRISSLFLIAALALSGCGRLNDAVDNANHYMPQIGDLKDNTSQTNEYLEVLKQGVHNQTLKDSLDAAFADRNLKYYPLPMPFMPGAQKFAETATSTELAQQTELWQLQVDMWKLDEVPQDLGTYKGLDAKIAKLQKSKDATSDSTKQQVAQLQQKKADLRGALMAKWKSYNLDKHVTLLVLGAIAGLAPQSTVEQLYHEQIENGGGALEKYALTFLAARADFISNSLLTLKRVPGAITNAKGLQEAINYTQALEYIARLPEASDVVLKTTGMFPEDPDKPKVVNQVDLEATTLLNPENMQLIWDDLKTAEAGIETDPKVSADQKTKLAPLAAVINQDQFWTAKAGTNP